MRHLKLLAAATVVAVTGVFASGAAAAPARVAYPAVTAHIARAANCDLLWYCISQFDAYYGWNPDYYAEIDQFCLWTECG